MSLHRRSAELARPGQAYAAAGICFAISGIMSMTFHRSDWGDRGTVMIALMVFAAVGGLLLLLRARKLARVRSLFQQVTLETPEVELVPGEEALIRLGLEPAREVEVTRVVFRLEQVESCHPEGEPMHVETAQVFQSEVAVDVGTRLPTGREHGVEASFRVPAEAPPTLELERHRVTCRVSVDIEGRGFEPVVLAWPLEVAARKAPAGSRPPAAPFTSRVEYEGLTVTLEAAEDPEVGGRLRGALVLQAEESLDHGEVRAALAWVAEGGSPEEDQVDEVVLADPGSLAAGETRLELDLPIPADAPPTYLGDLVRLRWSLRVTIDGLVDEPAPLALRVLAAD